LSESPWMTVVDKANKTVEINVEGIIGGDFWGEDGDDKVNTKEKMRAELKAIAAAKAETIIVNINSYGGEVNHGLSIHDILATHKAKVITRVGGFTASIATVIAMAGEHREMSANSLFLIHKPSLMLLGGFNANDMKRLNESLETVDKRIRDIYGKRGVGADKVDELMEENEGKGKWIDADEAKEMGFIDEVFEPLAMAACVNEPVTLSQLGISQIPQNHIDMTDTSKFKQMLDELKGWIKENIATKQPEAPEGDGGEQPPAAGNNEMLIAPAELDNRIKAIEDAVAGHQSNEQAAGDLTALQETHKAVVEQLETLKAENATQKQKLTEMEAKLVQRGAGGTEIEGPEGLEDPDGETSDPELKMLRNDLASLRAQLTQTHA